MTASVVLATTASPELVRVLLVDDEVRLVTFLREELEQEDYLVTVACDGDTAWREITSDPAPDLAVLDWNLPRISGLEICRRMREAEITIPVLMLTGHDEISDRVQALDAGVDDYLVKPFSVEELLARLRALQRRRWQSEPQVPDQLLTLGPLEVNVSQRSALLDGEAIELCDNEFTLLLQLVIADGTAVAPAALLEAVWGSDFVQADQLLGVYADSLLRKLTRPGQPPLLQRLEDGQLLLVAA